MGILIEILEVGEIVKNNDLKSTFEIGETIAVEFKRCGNGIENDVMKAYALF